MTAVDKNLKAKRELLRGVSLFATLRGRELGVVAANSEFYSYRKGDVVFSEGSFGDGLYVIGEGEVIITRQRADKETMTIAQFIAGESFGEMDLLENREMTATARAETDATLLVFPARGTSFQDMLGRHPGISARILHELLAFTAGRIRSTNRIISEKSPWVRDLKEQLYRDKLTGLYNRTYLDEEFPRQLADFGEESAIIMIKPDNFKLINDRCGHEAGDKALRLIAFTIRSQVREKDVAVRYRGDEFAVILPGTGSDGAARIAEQMRALAGKLNFDHITGEPGFSVTVSIGVAAYPQHAADPRKLVSICFNRMFAAREAGGDRIVSDGG